MGWGLSKGVGGSCCCPPQFDGLDGAALDAFAAATGIPVVVTQAGKGAILDAHPSCLGAVGVTGTAASNALAGSADVILAVGTRLQDFTTGSWALFQNAEKTIIGLNTQVFDATKHRALPLVADARVGLEELSANLAGWAAPKAWTSHGHSVPTRSFSTS